MKKNNFLFWILTSSLLLCGCNTNNSQIESIYSEYQNNGGQLDYSQWLSTIKGEDGKDGDTPYIGSNGNWWIGESDTGVAATGEKGSTGEKGEPGQNGSDGIDGDTPYIGENGNWWIGESDTGVAAEGKDGKDGSDGAPGSNGQDGEPGQNGSDGEPGKDGSTWLTGSDVPSSDLGTNGDLYLNTSTSDVYKKVGDSWTYLCNIKGCSGDDANSVTGIYYVQTVGNIDKYRIDFSDGSFTIFEVFNSSSYSITYDYGAASNLFTSNRTSDTVFSNSWITSLPTISPTYENSFLGWYIADTDKKIEVYDFIGGDITVYPKFNPESSDAASGLYQNGKYVKTWATIKEDQPTAFETEGWIIETLSIDGYLVIDEEITNVSLRAFLNNTGLTGVTIPTTATFIGGHTFEGCTNLKSAKISSSVKTIANDAFRGCTSLEKVTFGENSVLETIESCAFDGCTSLRNIDIPESITLISSGVFENCSSLTSITIPKNVTMLGTNAFSSCINLESVTFQEGSALTSIGNFAFDGCTSLKSLIIPQTVTYLGERFICNCKSLETLAFESRNDTYKSKDNCILSPDGTILYYGCKTSIIPDSVTTIYSMAFYNCTSLTSITIPSSVTVYNDNEQFGLCTNLKTVFIDSAAYANNMMSEPNCGSIIKYAKYVFIKTGLETNDSYYLYDYFTKQTTSNEAGYDMWIRK